MRWRIVIVGALSCVMFGSGSALASSATVTISEVQTGSITSASQEFVELYNQTSQPISLSGWSISYKSAAGSSWISKSVLTGTIAAHGFYLLGASGYSIGADQTFGSGLSGTGGHIRVVDADGVVVDIVGWGAAGFAEGNQPAVAPAGGQSIERLAGRLNPAGGNGVDSDNNATDFVLRTAAEPQSTQAQPEIADLTIAFEPVVDEVAPDAVDYLPILITELLIDPSSPKFDSQDEFIELYNPNDQDVNLAGYVLRTGVVFSDFYILPAYTLPSHGYISYYSRVSHLGLTNSGGAAQLLDPSGVISSQTGVYADAKSDRVWGLFSGSWQWSMSATPAAENIYEAMPVATISKSGSSKAAVKPKIATRLAPKSSTKTAKAKKEPAVKKTTTKSAFASVSSVLPKTSSGSWLIIGLLSLTIGYAIYEYRTDLQNRIYLTRRKLSAWRANRKRP